MVLERFHILHEYQTQEKTQAPHSLFQELWFNYCVVTQ